MNYPGRIIEIGESDEVLVAAIQHRLGLGEGHPDFDMDLKQAVMQFQARHVDNGGTPLQVDGRVGALTWEAMFGDTTVAYHAVANNAYLARGLEVAGREADRKVREIPANSNRGPDVERYLASVDKQPGLAWCVAFVYFCYNTAASELGRINPMVRTAGVLDHWNRCAREKGARRITNAQAVADPAALRPGMIFVIDHGSGLGHSGLIERVAGGIIETIEGNTDASKTREGGGVYRLRRKIADINTGFVDYAGL
jgi:hypothetical protein